MKLSDGRKVKMHVTPDCEERGRLAAEASRLLAEWLEAKDQVKMAATRKGTRAKSVDESKSAKRKLNAANRKYSQHVTEHGCW